MCCSTTTSSSKSMRRHRKRNQSMRRSSKRRSLKPRTTVSPVRPHFTRSTRAAKPRQLIEHRDCAFITVPFLTTRADPEQLEFLRETLKRTRGKQHVFVVAHYPSLPAFGNNLQPQLGGTDVLSLLHEHRVTGYLFGHRHRNGFRMHERTAHVLTDNMLSIHLLHVFPDRIILGRKRVRCSLVRAGYDSNASRVTPRYNAQSVRCPFLLDSSRLDGNGLTFYRGAVQE